jgi:hypothetical protein
MLGVHATSKGCGRLPQNRMGDADSAHRIVVATVRELGQFIDEILIP